MSRSARGGSGTTSSLESERARLFARARVLESFTETIDLEEVLRRVVDITREALGADRCWLLYPVRLDAEFATVTYESTSPAFPGAFQKGSPIPLAGSRA
ncbi:MAG TPA: GAF domain-containing protein, partial [Thermoanaerobaculia bacterium]